MENTTGKRKYFPSYDSSSDEEEAGVGHDGRHIPEVLRPADDTIDNAHKISPTTVKDGHNFDFAGKVIIQDKATAWQRATLQTIPGQYSFTTFAEYHAIDTWTVAVFVAGSCGKTRGRAPGVGHGIALKLRHITPDADRPYQRQEVVKAIKTPNVRFLCDQSINAIAILEGIEAAYSELQSAIRTHGMPTDLSCVG